MFSSERLTERGIAPGSTGLRRDVREERTPQQCAWNRKMISWAARRSTVTAITSDAIQPPAVAVTHH